MYPLGILPFVPSVLFEVLLQFRDPLFVTSSKLFRSTLPLEVIVKKLSMTVRLPIQGLRVHVNPIDERVLHFLLERSPLPLQLVVLKLSESEG